MRVVDGKLRIYLEWPNREALCREFAYGNTIDKLLAHIYRITRIVVVGGIRITFSRCWWYHH